MVVVVHCDTWVLRVMIWYVDDLFICREVEAYNVVLNIRVVVVYSVVLSICMFVEYSVVTLWLIGVCGV